MNPRIIEAGEYHVACIGYRRPDGRFGSIAKFDRSSDWTRHLEADEPHRSMRAIAHRLEPTFDSERDAVRAAADSA